MEEHNSSRREELYYDIQERFIEELYPWIMLDIPKIVVIHSVNGQNFYSSSLFWKLDLRKVNFS